MQGLNEILASLQKKADAYHARNSTQKEVKETLEAVKPKQQEAKKHDAFYGAELCTKPTKKFYKLYTRLLGTIPASAIMIYAYLENIAWANKRKTGRNIATVDYKAIVKHTGLNYELLRKAVMNLRNTGFIQRLESEDKKCRYKLMFNTRNEHHIQIPRKEAHRCFRGRYELFAQYLKSLEVATIDIKSGYVKVFDKYKNSRAEKLALPWLCKVFKIQKATLLLFLSRMRQKGLITIKRFRANRVITFVCDSAKSLMEAEDIRKIIEQEFKTQENLC